MGSWLPLKNGRLSPGLHVNFVKNEKMAQLNSMCTGDGLGRMLTRRDLSAVNVIFPLMAPFSDKSVGCEASSDLL